MTTRFNYVLLIGLGKCVVTAAAVDPLGSAGNQVIDKEDGRFDEPEPSPVLRQRGSSSPQLAVEVEPSGNARNLAMMRQEADVLHHREYRVMPSAVKAIENENDKEPASAKFDSLVAAQARNDNGKIEGQRSSDPDSTRRRRTEAPRRRRAESARRRRTGTTEKPTNKANMTVPLTAGTANSTNSWGLGLPDNNGKYFPIILVACSMVIVAIIVVIVVKVASAWNKSEQREDKEETLNVKLKPSSIDEDLYGLAVCVIVRDCRQVICGTDALGLRAARMATSVVTLSFLMALQVYILVEMDQLVASLAVNNVRSLYDRYELVMYGNDITHTREVAFGGRRGKPEFFNEANFYNLDEDDRDGVCQIALSQVTFLMTILLIWTLTCSADIKRATRFSLRVLYCTRHINSMRDALEDGEDIQDTHQDADIHTETISGLTLTVKAMLFPFMAIRIFVGCYLLWLGCLWLLATANFQEIVFNVVALDFVLVLQSLLYHTLVPARYKREVASTLLVPMDTDGVDQANVFTFFGNYFLIFACFLWVIVYTYCLQQILPEYQWDIQGPCSRYLEAQNKGST